jgi:hypothetical protein
MTLRRRLSNSSRQLIRSASRGADAGRRQITGCSLVHRKSSRMGGVYQRPSPSGYWGPGNPAKSEESTAEAHRRGRPCHRAEAHRRDGVPKRLSSRLGSPRGATGSTLAGPQYVPPGTRPRGRPGIDPHPTLSPRERGSSQAGRAVPPESPSPFPLSEAVSHQPSAFSPGEALQGSASVRSLALRALRFLAPIRGAFGGLLRAPNTPPGSSGGRMGNQGVCHRSLWLAALGPHPAPPGL